ncbi:hypothetical protein BGLA2_700027 [Burkholderia gladioli]|nr:hypothetical protein BGLA2_700027 [Burkholderia gladioli]
MTFSGSLGSISASESPPYKPTCLPIDDYLTNENSYLFLIIQWVIRTFSGFLYCPHRPRLDPKKPYLTAPCFPTLGPIKYYLSSQKAAPGKGFREAKVLKGLFLKAINSWCCLPDILRHRIRPAAPHPPAARTCNSKESHLAAPVPELGDTHRKKGTRHATRPCIYST